ncbi:hypothetical protein SLEP1_g28592 [Rubroshorea leprosula]|uniref:Uncharacterized protein n=1 Tax=Rubroshorea leprosula TaxID=152421 RepID=A0AAV5JU96_9ROSI|nr:hypothetical protein SLEP1_g28592 [Rubroshorea leprosula]
MAFSSAYFPVFSSSRCWSSLLMVKRPIFLKELKTPLRLFDDVCRKEGCLALHQIWSEQNI